MKKVMQTALICATLAIMFSCKKDDDSTNTTSTPNYMPLAIGNYWVYETFRKDTSQSIEESLNYRDSLVVTKDTMMDGNKFYFIENLGNQQYWDHRKWIRDSADYLIDSEGYKFFTHQNYEDTLAQRYEIRGEDTIYFIYRKMEELNNTVTVPAGSFGGIDSRMTLIDMMQEVSGTDRSKTMSTIYSENVGKVLHQYGYYSMSNWIYERRLVKYHVAEDSE